MLGKEHMTAPELKETGQRLFEAGQYTDALPLLKSAADAFPEDELLWQQLVLAAHYSGEYQQAVEFAKQGIRQHPRSGWLWRQLGSELTTTGRLDEAEKAFDNARNLLNDTDEWLCRYLSALHRKRQNLEAEIGALENLWASGQANSDDLHWLGIAYYNDKNFSKALEFYRQSGATQPNFVLFYNMGRVFSDPEISQHADAADAYRRALALKPDYELAKEMLDTTRRKLAPLAQQALQAATGLVQLEDMYQFYLSPYEVLQIEALERVEELDVKRTQRAKKRLLQEIELNDGRVSWLNNYSLDKSRALAMQDELLDDTKRRYHWAVFQNKNLLRFLTRGDIHHFLYSDDYFPHETLELLDDEPEFRAFLSKPFARQYNLILTRAIERRLLPVVEVLFDGRRWVEPEDEDICFDGSFRRIGDLVELMRSKAKDGRTRKVSLREMEGFLRQHSFAELFNLLPSAFASVQREVVEEIRSLAISCFNEHGDSDLSKEVLSLCKRFTLRSVELTKRLEEDFKTIERMIAEQRQHSFSALVRRNQMLHVTKGRITFAGNTVSAQEIEAIRWGIFVEVVNGVESKHSFSLVVRGSCSRVAVDWGKRRILAGLFRKRGEPVPIADLSTPEQQAYFQLMIDAATHQLIPALIQKLIQRLHAGQAVVIGPCALSDRGIGFRTGFIFRKDHVLSWQDVETQMHSGGMHVWSRANPKARVWMPVKDTDNAVILPILCAGMREGPN